MGWVLFAISLAGMIAVYVSKKRELVSVREAAIKAAAEHARVVDELQSKNVELTAENSSLLPFTEIRDTVVEVARIRAEADESVRVATGQANVLRNLAESEANEIRRKAQVEVAELRKDALANKAEARRKSDYLIEDANSRANRLIQDAEARAQEIAGSAYLALNQAGQLEQTAKAMRNVIEGYGDRYLKPTYSLLDQLADDYGFDDAGKELKRARANSQSMVDAERAASCDYVEKSRRQTAIRFVLDAFNGKVDTILGRVKADNAGTLEQQIRDAYSLVNHNGSAFRGARITPEYLGSRLDELRWAASVVALREKGKEEQRRIREQIREEERARREIERALRDAAKEEDLLQKAMAKIQAQVAKANEEQKAAFEEKLAELQERLIEAEIKNQRALSMAQQTKAGHVYVISNVGSFGEQVFKVGMTRRLEPYDRVRELGDASVPFPFDVHAMIWADDAPALENALHKKFLTAQVNKVNPRKEFFRISLADLKQAVEERGGKATWTLAAEANQYRETLAIEKSLAEQNQEARAWIRSQLDVEPEALALEDESGD